jgi:hypothetical protein
VTSCDWGRLTALREQRYLHSNDIRLVTMERPLNDVPRQTGRAGLSRNGLRRSTADSVTPRNVAGSPGAVALEPLELSLAPPWSSYAAHRLGQAADIRTVLTPLLENIADVLKDRAEL